MLHVQAENRLKGAFKGEFGLVGSQKRDSKMVILSFSNSSGLKGVALKGGFRIDSGEEPLKAPTQPQTRGKADG